jgi:hypothetical protein
MNRQELSGKHLVALSPVLTQQECAHWIARSEQRGYAEEVAPGGARCVLDDPGLAALLWSRLGPALIAPGQKPTGHLTARQHFHRFDIGQRSLPGPAGLGETEADLQGRLVVLLYLNEGYEGGETFCFLFEGPICVEPCRGLALVLPAWLTCEEMPVRHGRKYLLRLEFVP